MAWKTSDSSCGRTGSQIGSSNPLTTSSITAATLGTPSLINLGNHVDRASRLGNYGSLNVRIGITARIHRIVASSLPRAEQSLPCPPADAVSVLIEAVGGRYWASALRPGLSNRWPLKWRPCGNVQPPLPFLTETNLGGNRLCFGSKEQDTAFVPC